MPVEINALESARFGVVAAHVIDRRASFQEINAAAHALNVEMLTLRSDCADHAFVHAAEADGFRLMDTVVYYERALAEAVPELAPAANVLLRKSRPADVDVVGDIARAAFSNYIGHFHADPRLEASSADAAYVDWAQTSVSCQSEGEKAIVVSYRDRSAGFLTLNRKDRSEFEIVLNAVHPEFQRLGLYERLLHAALVLGQQAGGERMIVSTQLNNCRVQRAWVKLGFRLVSARHTFHKWFS